MMRFPVAILFLLLILSTSCHDNPPLAIPQSDADNGGLFLPDGFGALVVVDSIGPSRHMAVNDNGDVYVKLRITTGNLFDRVAGNAALRDLNNDGRADIVQRFGNYPNDGPFGTEMRIHKGYLYYSSEQMVYRQKLSQDKLIPDSEVELIFMDHHPPQWHNAKSLAFDHEGGMYVTFSAPTNVCEDWNSVPENTVAHVKGEFPCPQLIDQAGIWRFDEGKLGQSQSDGQKFATGLRSIVAISWNERDNRLYAVVHGRDYLYGHAPQYFNPWQNAVLPAEEFVRIGEGDDFGWPYTYYDPFKKKRMVSPEYGGDGIREAREYANPLLGLPAHWAPNDLLFYKGRQFPARYKAGAFIAFHGSTNRGPYPQGGYIVAFVPFENGEPKEQWEVFADGFAGVDTIASMKDARYRPMGLSEGPDGSLYVIESRQGKIWRIIFNGDSTKFNAANLAMKRKSRTYIKALDEKQDLLSSGSAVDREENH